MNMAKITEKMITDMMAKMKCDREEAIDVIKWDMEDDDCQNEEAKELQEKMAQQEKESKKPKKDTIAKVKTQKAKKKEDKTKSDIMKILENLLNENDNFVSPQKMTASKFTFTDKDGNDCSI